MIAILLILAAAGCLVAGIILDSPLLSYGALGASALAVLILVLAVRHDRKRALAPASETIEPGTQVDESIDEPQTAAEKAQTVTDEDVENAEATEADTAVADEAELADAPITDVKGAGDGNVLDADAPSSMAEPDTTTSVIVVPGRKRYHRPDCELVTAPVTEEITIADATDEGFSPCTVCTPNGIATAEGA